MAKKQEKKSRGELTLLIILIILLVIIDVLFFLSFKIKISFQSENSENPASESFKVAEIVDGDTLKLENGQYVRLLSINAPEKNEPFYSESANFLKLLALDKIARLERDKDDRDNYGRLLRYVYVDLYGKEVFINEESIREGYSVSLIINPNTKYQAQIEQARQDCLQSKLNLCGIE